MAKKNVVIFDGEDKFINPKKAVYSKTRGQSKKVESFKSARAAVEDEQGPTEGGSSGSTQSEPLTQPAPEQQATPSAPTGGLCPQGYVWDGTQCIGSVPASPLPIPSTPIEVPNVPLPDLKDIKFPSPEELFSKNYSAPIPELPSVTAAQELRNTSIKTPLETSTVTLDTAAAPAYSAPTPQLPSATPSLSNSGEKTCPAGMRLYFGTCIPITNTKGACQQGYMKEYEGGPCVPIPASGAIGGCAAGYEYKMGYRQGDLTATMGCYPIGSTQDIGTGSSTGGILGGGSGSNIGGGGTVQGGGGSQAETPEGKIGIGAGDTIAGITCNENQVYDPVTGSCIAKEKPAPVPCPAGFVLNEKTGTCIESLNPKDYKCPPVDLPTPPKCKKYAVVGKDVFGCDRYDLVDDAYNCPDIIEEKPIQCQDGLIYSLELKKCVNPIDETKRPPLTTPEGTCPVGFEFSITEQKCISKCPEGKVYDPVNLICVEPTPYTPKTPYCSQNMIWDEKQQKCVFSGTVTKPPVTSQTTTTTTLAPTKDTLGILPVSPIGGGGGGTGGGGGGGEEEAAAKIAKKNYFWWYVGGAVLAYYLYKKYKKKN